jgi:hypothetical protein
LHRVKAGARHHSLLVRAWGREPQKWVRLPHLFYLMASPRVAIHQSSSTPPLHPPPPLSLLSCTVVHAHNRKQRGERIRREGCFDPLLFFWTPLQKLLEQLQCCSAPLFLLPGSFTELLDTTFTLDSHCCYTGRHGRWRTTTGDSESSVACRSNKQLSSVTAHHQANKTRLC